MPIFAALIPAVISGGAAIGASLIGKSGADKQAQTQSAANAKIDAYGAPYRAAGTNALAQYGNAAGLNGASGNEAATQAFLSSPLYKMTYQPAYDEAAKGVTRYGSANGSLDSGRTLMALQDRAARIGGQTFGDYLGTLGQAAGQGQSAAFGSAGQLQTGTNALNSAYGEGTNALAAGALGLGSAAVKGGDAYNYLAGQSSYRPPPVAPQYAAKGQALY